MATRNHALHSVSAELDLPVAYSVPLAGHESPVEGDPFHSFEVEAIPTAVDLAVVACFDYCMSLRELLDLLDHRMNLKRREALANLKVFSRRIHYRRMDFVDGEEVVVEVSWHKDRVGRTLSAEEPHGDCFVTSWRRPGSKDSVSCNEG